MNNRSKVSVLIALYLVLLFELMSVPAALAQITKQVTSDTAQEDREAHAQNTDHILNRHFHPDRFLENIRRPIGFSIGAYHLFTPDALTSSSGKESAEFVSITPRIFAFIHSKKTELYLDYTFGRRMYVGRSSLNSSDHSASLKFQRYLTRKSSLEIADGFQSGFNDKAFTALSIDTLLIDGQAGFSSETYFKRQRLTSNNAIATVSFQTGRNSNIYVFASHNYSRYAVELFDAQDLQSGVGGSYQINKWMFFESRFATYFKTAGKSSQHNNIQRLQIAGLRYQTKNKFDFSSSGGIEYTRLSGLNKTTAGIQAGVAKTSNVMRLALAYHHGFTSVFSKDAVLNGHTAVASVDQTLSKRVSYQASINLTQAESLAIHGAVRIRSANAGLSIILQKHIVANTSASFISQRSSQPFVNSHFVDEIDRYTVSAGLQYFLPTLLGK